MTDEQHTQLMQCLHDLESDLDKRILELERKQNEAAKMFERLYLGIKRLLSL